MHKLEAIQAMLDGKKTRIFGWDDGEYVQINGYGNTVTQDGESIDLNSLSHVDWELYEEPEPKKTPIALKDLLNPKLKSFTIEWEGVNRDITYKPTFSFHNNYYLVRWENTAIDAVIKANALGLPCYTFDDLEGSQGED